MTIRHWLPALTLLLVPACAGTATHSNEKAESSSAAIRAAEEVGATHSPQAALHLQLAKEQFERARSMTDPKHKASADRLLMRAQSDADLALALARTEKDKAEALDAINQVKKLTQSQVQ